MKIIDLLNKIANGEEVPKKIRITILDDRITRKYNFFYDEDDQEYKDNELFPLGARLILDRVLNKKVEVLDLLKDPKKIEKWGEGALEEMEKCTNYTLEDLQKYIRILAETQNELIDEINNLKGND